MDEKDIDLEEQLAILGVDLGSGVAAKPEATVQTTGTATIPTPYTPENPTNVGVVTNNIVPEPIQQVVQKQVNEQAQAQVVQQTVTNPQVGISQSTTIPVAPKQVVSKQVAPQDDEVVFIDLAKAVYSQKTPWMRLKDNEWSRVLIVDLAKTQPMKLHYIKGLGWIKCLSKYTPEGWLDQPCHCCRKLVRTPNGLVWETRLDEDGNEIKAKNRYLVPVIEYPVDKNSGKKIVPGQLPQLKMWNMNAVEWGDLVKAVQAIADDPDDLYSADLTNVDFLLHKDPSSRFKTIDITAMPKSFRSDFEANIKDEIGKLNQEFFSVALKEARKVVSEETIINAYNNMEQTAQAVNTALDDMIQGSQDLSI